MIPTNKVSIKWHSCIYIYTHSLTHIHTFIYMLYVYRYIDILFMYYLKGTKDCERKKMRN